MWRPSDGNIFSFKIGERPPSTGAKKPSEIWLRPIFSSFLPFLLFGPHKHCAPPLSPCVPKWLSTFPSFPSVIKLLQICRAPIPRPPTHIFYCVLIWLPGIRRQDGSSGVFSSPWGGLKRDNSCPSILMTRTSSIWHNLKSSWVEQFSSDMIQNCGLFFKNESHAKNICPCIRDRACCYGNQHGWSHRCHCLLHVYAFSVRLTKIPSALSPAHTLWEYSSSCLSLLNIHDDILTYNFQGWVNNILI